MSEAAFFFGLGGLPWAILSRRNTCSCASGPDHRVDAPTPAKWNDGRRSTAFGTQHLLASIEQPEVHCSTQPLLLVCCCCSVVAAIINVVIVVVVAAARLDAETRCSHSRSIRRFGLAEGLFQRTGYVNQARFFLLALRRNEIMLAMLCKAVSARVPTTAALRRNEIMLAMLCKAVSARVPITAWGSVTAFAV